MANVIFNRPVRIGGIVYPKARRSVEIPDQFMKSKLMTYLLKTGEASIPPAPAKPAAKADDAPPAKTGK